MSNNENNNNNNNLQLKPKLPIYVALEIAKGLPRGSDVLNLMYLYAASAEERFAFLDDGNGLWQRLFTNVWDMGLVTTTTETHSLFQAMKHVFKNCRQSESSKIALLFKDEPDPERRSYYLEHSTWAQWYFLRMELRAVLRNVQEPDLDARFLEGFKSEGDGYIFCSRESSFLGSMPFFLACYIESTGPAVWFHSRRPTFFIYDLRKENWQYPLRISIYGLDEANWSNLKTAWDRHYLITFEQKNLLAGNTKANYRVKVYDFSSLPAVLDSVDPETPHLFLENFLIVSTTTVQPWMRYYLTQNYSFTVTENAVYWIKYLRSEVVYDDNDNNNANGKIRHCIVLSRVLFLSGCPINVQNQVVEDVKLYYPTVPLNAEDDGALNNLFKLSLIVNDLGLCIFCHEKTVAPMWRINGVNVTVPEMFALYCSAETLKSTHWAETGPLFVFVTEAVGSEPASEARQLYEQFKPFIRRKIQFYLQTHLDTDVRLDYLYEAKRWDAYQIYCDTDRKLFGWSVDLNRSTHVTCASLAKHWNDAQRFEREHFLNRVWNIYIFGNNYHFGGQHANSNGIFVEGNYTACVKGEERKVEYHSQTKYGIIVNFFRTATLRR